MLEDDFPLDTVEWLKQELGRFSGECHYDSNIKRIVFNNDRDAMKAYMYFQSREMEKYKWVESEKAHKDLGEKALLDWDRKYATSFSEFWKKTHKFIPKESVVS